MELEIKELKDLYQKHVIDKKIIDKNNCFELLEFYTDISSPDDISNCIDFISSHFYEIAEIKLKLIIKKLGYETIQKIITNDKLKLKDEDLFADFIISLTGENDTFIPLIEYIHFGVCSENTINRILDIITTNNYYSIIKSLHDSVLRSRFHCHKFDRYFVSFDIRLKIDEIKNSSDYYDTYNFLDDLSRKGNRIIIAIALEEGLRFDKIVLLEAARQGNLSLITSLILCGCNKNAMDSIEQGYTPLIWAAHNGHLEVVKYLISIGANINAETDDGSLSLIHI